MEGAALLPDPCYLVAVAMHVSGDVVAALIDAVACGKMGTEREGAALLMAGIWCKDKENKPVPAALISEARTVARCVVKTFVPGSGSDSPVAHRNLVALAHLIRDESLLLVLKLDCFVESYPWLESFYENLIDVVKDSVLGFVPEYPEPVAHSGFTLRRAVARVGRTTRVPAVAERNTRNVALKKTKNDFKNPRPPPG